MSNKKLKLRFHGKILDQLGIQAYHTPSAALSELVSNAWDADAHNVHITLPDISNQDAEIIIKDDGSGMTFLDCENRYLNIGYNRRELEKGATSKGMRPILGRKGIGKFAGFGISEKIHIRTISEETGEETCFELNINELRGDSYIDGVSKDIPTEHSVNPANKKYHGTTITLKSLNLPNKIRTDFSQNMSRKFLLHKNVGDFNIFINNEPLKNDDLEEEAQYEFPRDYEEVDKSTIDDFGRGIVNIDDKHIIKWKVYFTYKPIKLREMQGITIFVNGKLAQNPFFFEIGGGIGGQTGQSYMTGHIEADYIDGFENDLISPERQRINWNMTEAQPLLEWGANLVKKLLILWHDKRGKNRRELLEKRVGPLRTRLEKLNGPKRKEANKVLQKIGTISSIDESQYEDIAHSVIFAIEQDRLHELWAEIEKADTLDGEKFISVLMEAGVISALNMAESVKTNLITISKLKSLITDKVNESQIRNYIAENPQLLGPEWELFEREKSLKNTILKIGDSNFKGEVYDGRLDLVLFHHDELLIIEFMKPGLHIDWEHADRCRRYVFDIRAAIEREGKFKKVNAVIVADSPIRPNPSFTKNLLSMKDENIEICSWDTIIDNAASKWKNYLEILVERGNHDVRLLDLSGSIDDNLDL